MISASILADSTNPNGSQLTTFLLTYPRFIHSEFMTHRAFSRNAASSRAIPIEKMMQAVNDNPAYPEHWGANKPGMQAGDQLRSEIVSDIGAALGALRGAALETVEIISDIGLHKQVANCYLEPWAHITVIATAEARGLNNFFNLRASPMAQPEFQVLAYRMLNAYLQSVPHQLPWGGWHIPYQPNPSIIHQGTFEVNESVIKSAVGRIARVSYNRNDDDDPAKNIELHDRLSAAGHWSPFEHVARAWGSDTRSNFDVGWGAGQSGWLQYRKHFPTECKSFAFTDDLITLMNAKPDWITL